MEIIIEYVLIDNLVVNFLILYSTAFVLKLNTSKWRIILSNLFGTVMALILPIVVLPNLLIILLKIFVGATMVFIAFKFSKIKEFLLIFLTFISSTALYGGVCFALCYFLSGSLDLNESLKGVYDFPAGIALFVLCVFFLLIKGVISYAIKKQKSKKFIFEIEFQFENKKVKTLAYLDSGHKLNDPDSNEPIIIINYAIFNKLFKIPIEEILLKKIPKQLKNAHYIKISTINSQNQEMLVFNMEIVKINLLNNKIIKKNTPLGLSLTNFQKTFDCNVLISPDLI